ncbi:MAG: hypothetical protein KKA32_11930 [Actinobacteria bacterium]|nr:hypothetical protein [Actinomycetota bacterium]
MKETDERLTRLDTGRDVDLSIRNGVLVSTKMAFALGDGHYGIFHAVDGTVVTFTREGMREVLEGVRDPRDGDEEESGSAISEEPPGRPS